MNDKNYTTANLLPDNLLHGGDYNPDQWLDRPDILEEDIRLMKEAHVNCVSLGIFAWGILEPEEGRFEFDWLEEIIDHLYENGIYTILATPTAARPLWLSNAYPETRQMLSNGIRKLPGERHNMCASSPVMREKMRRIDTELSRRFGRKEAVIAWHISNEYAGGGGTNGDGACYCPNCQAAFRGWLKNRYQTLEKLNKAWWTGFWSNTVTDWEQIHAPSVIGENRLEGLHLDWKRFTSDELLDFCKEEIESVRKYSNLPVTTNYMGFFYPLDYFKWSQELDFTSFDSYPSWHLKEDEAENASFTSATYDLTRSLKKEPFLLMESVTSTVEWMPRNPLKRPGVHRLSSLQAVASGSNSVQYFQWRKGRGSCEKFHGSVLDHRNGSNTRVFRDTAELGHTLEQISKEVLATCNLPKVAIVFDWENWWAIQDATNLLNPFDLLQKWMPYYRGFWELGVDVDIVNMDDTLEGYELVAAPVNYMYRGAYAENVRKFVANGGTYITTYYSGEVDENGLCFLDRHPLSDVLGIRTEEIDVRPEYTKNQIAYGDQTYEIADLCALIHPESAEVLGTYTSDFYAGMAALTHSHYQKGETYFIATEATREFLKTLYKNILKEKSWYQPLVSNPPYGVTVSTRNGETTDLYFLQNYNRKSCICELATKAEDIETGEILEGSIQLDPYQCRILREYK